VANTPLNLQIIANEFLNQVQGCQDWQERFDPEEFVFWDDEPAAKLGHAFLLPSKSRFPFPFDIADIQSIHEYATPVVLQHQVMCMFQVEPSDLTQDLDRFSGRYIRPEAIRFARAIVAKWPAGSTLVNACMWKPSGMDCATTRGVEGISIRVCRAYDMRENLYLFQVDALFGCTAAVVYMPSLYELELVALLHEARAELVSQLEDFRMAA
jgi:hypothetical protein